MEDCPVAILVDLTEPEEKTFRLFSCSSQEEDKENEKPLTDSIEIVRSGDTERRLSLTLKNSQDIQNRILRDVTEQSLSNSAKECQSPVLRLIDDETFDFDLASPALRAEDVSREEEDEVFFGPVCFTERLKQTVVDQEVVPPLSPLNLQQLALMVKEANCVAYRIKNSVKSDESEISPSLGSKTSCSSTEGETSPSDRKHLRSGTFTKSPLESLSEEVRKVLPVIEDSKKTIHVQERQNNLGVTDGESSKKVIDYTNSTQSSQKRKSLQRLQPPSKIQGSRLAKPSSIKYGSSCESLDSKDSRTSGHESDGNSSIASDNSDLQLSKAGLTGQRTLVTGKNSISKTSKLQVPGSKINKSFNSSMNCSLNTSTNDTSMKVNLKTSRLAVPNAGVTPKYGIQDKLQNSTGSVKKVDLSKTAEKKQQKSAELQSRTSPRLRAKQDAAANEGLKKAGILSLKGPVTKLSLMKPGEMQKRMNKPITGNGPMKAVQPLETFNSSLQDGKETIPNHAVKISTCEATPVKAEKYVKPKLLANNFSTPTKLSSGSSVNSTSTPVSNKRKSCLPTPQKSRCSVSSIPGSPISGRGGSSTSSRQSLLSSCSSVSESPVFNSDMLRSKTGFNKTVGQTYVNETVEESPSTLKMNKSRVVHTPQLPQKIQSKWSPIRRQRPLNREEEIIQCTKRKL